MSIKKRTRAKHHLFYRLWKRLGAATKGLMAWLLRILFVAQRPARLAKAGFVLPTVVMVTLVVTLLTSAILARSFDRAQTASNYRVSEEVLNAALPALDRAKAKINALFEDPNLPRGTPTEVAINDVLVRPKYTIGDETRLSLAYDFGNGTGTFTPDNAIQTFTAGTANSFENAESITTAWRFPVDTDNNGLFDSFTLYSILSRSPSTNASGTFSRQRTPLDTRSLPLDEGSISGSCAAAAGTSSSLIGTNGWIQASGQLKKSFFVYVATVPITNTTELGLGNDYEDYPGLNQGFSSLEYQRDVGRIPLSNNAVVYEDDLIATPGPTFRLNGRVVTNSNLALQRYGNDARFYQVSSVDSCFYDPENAKIVVGGNYVYGGVDGGANDRQFDVDLYDGEGNNPVAGEALNRNRPSVTELASGVLYNTQVYELRINRLVELAKTANGSQTVSGAYPTQAVFSSDPRDVKNGVEALINGPNQLDPDDARDRELDSYFRKRTRRVPFAEVAAKAVDPEVAAATTTDLQGAGTDALRPPNEWIYPFDPADGQEGDGFSELTLNIDGDGKLQPPATEFTQQLITDQGKESHTGDRAVLGNNLPELLYNAASGQWLGEEESQSITGTEWDRPNNTAPRQRKTRVRSLDDLGDISRDGFWETKAAEIPVNELDNIGGLRIVTDAGLYLPAGNGITGSNVIWPDTMPVIPGADTTINPAVPAWLSALPTDSGGNPRPFLRMRATAVYHFRYDDDSDAATPAPPIACVDTYYNPTDATTAARTNNGKVYAPPSRDVSNATIKNYLTYEASLRYPNGRQVNELLSDALAKVNASEQTTLAEQSAIDAAICSLQIYGQLSTDTTWGSISASTTPTSGYTLPDGAIREVAFLDARQIKAIDAPSADDTTATPNYNDTFFDVTADSLTNLYNAIGNENAWYRLPIEQRQPLEVRVTQISIDDLRKNRADSGNSTGADEYMLPNSGIIYASRNDALTDDSDSAGTRLSANDFILDPTRRTNGVMLINGGRLARTTTPTSGISNDFREIEKGLTLVSNLPVYVKGEFNPHKDAGGTAQEEFTEALAANYSNFYTRDQDDANDNFACREGDPRLPATSCLDPDEWRTGNILSDAVTLLSSGFAEGNRADGDFDLRNNQTDNLSDPDGDATDEISQASEVIEARLRNGFWNNNYVTSHDFTDTKYSAGTGYAAADDSSYFNNFVTPIQRRVAFPEYIMEICRKLPISECEREDWVVGFDADGDGVLTGAELTVSADQLGAQLAAAGKNDGGNDVFENAEVAWSNAYTTSGNSKSPLARLGAGTTARPALLHEDIDGDGILDTSPNEDINGNGVLDDDWRYPRRVAFARNRYGKLALTDVNSNATAKPMGVGCPLDSTGNEADNNGCQYKDSTGWTAGTHYGVSANNALWFRTTKDTSGDPDNAAEIVYRADRPLYYEDPVGDGGKIILPDTQCFTNTAIVACDAIQVDGTFNLNLPTTDKASDYTLCLDSNGGPNAGQAKLQYKVGAGDLGNPACGAAPRNAIDDAIGQGSASGIKQFSDNVSTGNGWTTSGNGANALITGGTLNAEGPVTVYDLPKKTFESGATITLDANGETKPVFVLRADNNTEFGDCDGCDGVQLELVGVDPNDVFWYANGIRMENANAANPHILAGNFIGNTAAPQMGDNTRIDGGRFLGYTTAPNFPSGLTITAVTADGQPLLTPVLQTQYPAIATPPTNDDNLTAPEAQTVVENTNWQQQPTTGTTIFNMVMASGDVPNRPPFTATGLFNNQHLGDYNGGLPNLPRFLENWNKSGAQATTKIRGSLIQLQRSEVATAPFFALGEKRSQGGSGAYTTGGPFDYPQVYTQSGGGGRMPFFTPPGRDWGFDVGLLSQIPDLLAQQFLAEPASEPNQYFREVGRGDDWIQTLLCAQTLDANNAEVGDAINTDQRPTAFCQQKSSDLP